MMELRESILLEEHERIVDMLLKPLEQLKPLEDLYRKENPREDGKFYIPDATAFYKWITNKILKNENLERD